MPLKLKIILIVLGRACHYLSIIINRFLVLSVTKILRNVNVEICSLLEYLCIRAQGEVVGWAC